MSGPSLESILVCGRGLAFEITLAALAQNLPKSVKLTAIEIQSLPDHDVFYGNVTSPLAYEFLLRLGLDEPGVLKNTDTVFSYGTSYKNWADKLSWTQVHHLAFPVWNNVQFHQYLRRLNAPLEPYLVNAAAGKEGVFAHPPNDAKIPLSRAEYGYQFRPQSLYALLKQQPTPENVTRDSGEIEDIIIQNGEISSVILEDGRDLSADLFIDATGITGALVSSLDTCASVTRNLAMSEHLTPSTSPASVRKVEGKTYGWQSVTSLQNHNSILTVSAPEDIDRAKADISGDIHSEFTIAIGRQHQGWVGNCVSIGHANTVIEPLTPAPMMMLQLDIERLLSLIPVTADMSVEQQEFNRLLDNDREHCEMFNVAFFNIPQNPNTAYWASALSNAKSVKLTRKLTQFESRGHLTAFDFEPFNEQDWTILHFGLGRTPDRYDPFIDNVSEATIRGQLDQLQSGIEQIVKKMPPHGRYIENFLNYLERKHGR
ncbi:MAG: tryptophan halogenase [Hyphomonadaceae bacterium]|nr:tryptophan halogenase [Hyphomonadaceae bacterium]